MYIFYFTFVIEFGIEFKGSGCESGSGVGVRVEVEWVCFLFILQVGEIWLGGEHT